MKPFLSALVLTLFACQSSSAQTYRTSDAFSQRPFANPSGPWTFGYRSSDGAGPFKAFDSSIQYGFVGEVRWVSNDFLIDDWQAEPWLTVYYNPTPDAAPCDGDWCLNPGQVAFHPGQAQGLNAVVRFTAPVAGTYQLAGDFELIDPQQDHPAPSGVGLRANGGGLSESANLWSWGTAEASWSLVRTLTLQRDEVVEFMIDDGPDQNYHDDGTAFDISFRLGGDSDGDGIDDSVDMCPSTVTDNVNLKPNHYAWIGGTSFIRGGGKGGTYTLAATQGCSCADILSRKPGNNGGESKFGCSQGTMNNWVAGQGWAAGKGPMEQALPGEIKLSDAYPNPFNPQTVIGFDLVEDSAVSLQVFDVMGRRVAVLVDSPRGPGRHEAIFDAAGLPTGLYLYRLTAGGVVLTRTMLLSK